MCVSEFTIVLIILFGEKEREEEVDDEGKKSWHYFKNLLEKSGKKILQRIVELLIKSFEMYENENLNSSFYWLDDQYEFEENFNEKNVSVLNR